MFKSTLGLSAVACTSLALLSAAPASAGPKSPQTPSELGAQLQSQGYKVQYERIGNCALDAGSVVGTRIGPAVWAETEPEPAEASRGATMLTTRSLTSRWRANAPRNELVAIGK
jgi:hypothetical protein